MAKLLGLTCSPRPVCSVDWCPQSTYLPCELKVLSVQEWCFLENFRQDCVGGKADNYFKEFLTSLVVELYGLY